MHPSSTTTAPTAAQPLKLGFWEQFALAPARDFVQIARYAPAAVAVLMIYAALSSSAIFDPGASYFWGHYVQNPGLNLPWLASYFNKFDLLLFAGIAITWITRPLRLELRHAVFLLAVLTAIVISLLPDIESAQYYPVLDPLVNWARFALVFTLSVGLVRAVGQRPVESLLFVLFLVLGASSLVVYGKIFAFSQRLYAAGMTVASSSQVATITIFVALVRRQYAIMAVAVAYLLLTFSLTSIGLLLLLFFTFALLTQEFSVQQRFTAFALILLVMCVGIYLTANVPQFEVQYTGIYEKLPGTSGNFTLDGRTQIWSYGLQQIGSGSIGLLGVGFGKTSSVLNQMLFPVDNTDFAPVPHFHTIILEYLIGMGVLSLFIFAVLLQRIIRTWQARCYPAALIFTFFFLCQSLDFTVYHPKEVIMWALMLGLAEGQWQMERAAAQRRATATAMPAPVLAHGRGRRVT